jgi:hypothetical protein
MDTTQDTKGRTRVEVIREPDLRPFGHTSMRLRGHALHASQRALTDLGSRTGDGSARPTHHWRLAYGPVMTGQVMAIGWTSTVACKGRHISLGSLLSTAVRRRSGSSRRTQMARGGRHLGRGVRLGSPRLDADSLVSLPPFSVQSWSRLRSFTRESRDLCPLVNLVRRTSVDN